MSLAGARPTPRLAGLLLVGAALATGGLAWSPLSLAALLLDLLLVGAVVSELRALPSGAAFSARRSLPTPIQLGESAEVRLSVLGPPGRAWLLDEAPVDAVSAEDLERRLAVRLPASDARYPLRPRRRGALDFGPLNLIVEGRLGLVARRIVLEPEGVRRLEVRPAFGLGAALDVQGLLAELGLRRRPRRGEGTELAGLREAVPEDDARRIDARASARLGRPVARVYEPEQDQELLIGLDVGRRMGAVIGPDGETKLDRAAAVAARLAAVALAQHDRVGLLCFGGEAGAFVPPGRGRAHLGRLLEVLTAATAEPVDASWTRALEALRRRQKKRALVVFLTELADPGRSSATVEVLGLLARRHRVLYVALRDPELRALADAAPEDEAALHLGLAALALDDARGRAMAELARRGVRALDRAPDEVDAATLRAYLSLRARET